MHNPADAVEVLAIEFIRKELDVTMALTGVSRIADIDRRVLAD